MRYSVGAQRGEAEPVRGRVHVWRPHRRSDHAPLLDRLGSTLAIEDARGALDLAVMFWNASVFASKHWPHPRAKDLNALRHRMRGRHATPDNAATFDLLTERWRSHWLDPRLVESWTYDTTDDTGARRFVCSVALPDGVRAEVPPPIEKRIAIGGRFLDEVRIASGNHMYLVFPVDRHRCVIGANETATVHAMMPSALQLFAEGRLPRVGGAPVEVVIGGRKLGMMVLADVRCGGENNQHDVAILVFKHAPTAPTT
jgi:hypothetical protein